MSWTRTRIRWTGRGISPRPGPASRRRGRRVIPVIAAVLLSATAPGCGGSGVATKEPDRSTALVPQEEVLVLEVAPDRVRCVGEMVGLCLQVKGPEETGWRKFYDPIEGFEYEPGVRYVIEVARRDVPDPPADASAYAYRLLRILEEERLDR